MDDYNFSWVIEKGRLVIKPEHLLVRQYLDIWDHYKDKNTAEKMLRYVFGLNDITVRNPWLDVKDDDRKDRVEYDIWGKAPKFTEKENQLIKEASEAYQYLNKNSPWRLSKTLSDKIDELNNWLTNNKIVGDNAKEQIEAIMKIEKLLMSKKQTDELVIEQVKRDRAKGDKARSPNELDAY